MNPGDRVRKLQGNAGMVPERRSCSRHRVHAPAFAIFDGVTGGMILDLSEQGMSMQTAAPQKPSRQLNLNLNLPDPVANVETTGYIAWADAFGRAGVRFSDISEEARRRIKDWLSMNASTPSRKAPKFTVPAPLDMISAEAGASPTREPLAISLEPEFPTAAQGQVPASTTVQYEFAALGPDLYAALRLISERARALTRGTGAAIGLAHNGRMLCRASAGVTAPPLGAPIDVNSGFSGECIRTGQALRCDDAESDSRVDLVSCQRLGIRSIIAAPIQYEREIVGIVEVFSTQPFAFDEGDIAVVQRIAQTVLLAMSQAAELDIC